MRELRRSVGRCRLMGKSAAFVALSLVVAACSPSSVSTTSVAASLPATTTITTLSTSATTPPPTIPSPTAGTWRTIDTYPYGARAGHTAVWSGEELIVFGGSASNVGGSNAGAAYDPRTDTWRPLANAPIQGRSRHTAVWTGTEMIIWGGRNPGLYSDGAAYDPTTDTWRVLGEAPLDGRSNQAAVWTGSEMIVFGGHTSIGNNAYADDGASYDPATDTWERLNPSGLRARSNPSVVWTGVEVIVWGGVNGQELWQNDGAAYNPTTQRWRDLSESPLDGREAALAAWTGTEAVFVGGVSNTDRFRVGAAAYKPATDQWRPIDGPAATSWALGSWTSRGLLDLNRYRLWDGDAWYDLPQASPVGSFGATATWTGQDMIMIGGEVAQDTPGDSAVAFRIGDPQEFIPTPTTTLPPLRESLEARMTATIEALEAFGPRVAGTEPELESSFWIQTELERLTGILPFEEDFLLPNDHGSRNVWVTLGSGEIHVLLGGHYDSVEGSPGVDDNLSGVAVLLELAARLARDPIDGLSVTIVAFGAEEVLPGYGPDDHHFGSRHMAERLAHENDLPGYMVSVDMVGVGSRLMAVTYETLDPTAATLLQTAAGSVGVDVTRLSRGDISDHEAFARAGVPSVFMWRPDNPAWHTPGDAAFSLPLLVEDLAILESLLQVIVELPAG